MFDIYFNIHRLSKVWGQQVKKLFLFFLKDHVTLKTGVMLLCHHRN